MFSDWMRKLRVVLMFAALSACSVETGWQAESASTQLAVDVCPKYLELSKTRVLLELQEHLATWQAVLGENFRTDKVKVQRRRSACYGVQDTSMETRGAQDAFGAGLLVECTNDDTVLATLIEKNGTLELELVYQYTLTLNLEFVFERITVLDADSSEYIGECRFPSPETREQCVSEFGNTPSECALLP